MSNNNYMELLNKLGFKIDSMGYQYWLYAIKISKKEYWKYSYNMEILYNEIAKRLNTSRGNIERCMRTSSIPAKENIREYFNYTGKITTKVILQLLIRK